MNVSKRSMKRSRQQALLTIENHNRQNLDQLVAMINEFMESLAILQREVLVLRTTLMERRIVSELELEQTRLQIKQFEEMKSKGLILGE